MTRNPDADGRLLVLEAITDSALGRLDLDQLLHTMLERVRDLFEVDTATVLLLDPSAKRLTAAAAAGMEEEVYQGVSVPLGLGFAGRVAQSRAPVLLEQVDSTTVVNSLLWEKGLRVLLGVPMLARDELVGVLHIGAVTEREFTDGDISLLRLVADRLAMAVRTEADVSERVATTALQRSLLPSALPVVDGLEFAGRYVPGAQISIGGDWYDVFPLPGDRLGVVIGDVTGCGLGAAVIMGRLRSALRAYALDDDDPAGVLGKLDRKACHFEPGVMATVSYAVLEPSHQRLTLSLAGHLPPILALPGQQGAVLDIPADLPIGIGGAPGARRRTTVELPPGSTIAFYTDGLVERRGSVIDVGLDKLAGAVTAESAERVCAQAMAALIGSAPVRDDVALLVAHKSAA